MFNAAVLLACVVIATAVFGWLASSLLAVLSWPVARLGSMVHRLFGILPHNESEAWMFALLMGISRVLVLAVAIFAFATALAAAVLPVPEIVLIARDTFISAFFVLLVMRLVAIFLGAVVIGGSVRTVLKTLKS